NDILRLNGRVYAPDVSTSLQDRLVRLVEEAHRARPLEPGVSLQEVRSRLNAPAELVDHVLARAAERRLVETVAGVIRAFGWSPRLTDSQREKLHQIEDTIQNAAHEPPSVAELEARFGAQAPELLRMLEREGRIIAVEADRFYSSSSLAQLIDRLHVGMVKGRVYSHAELRDVLGFSRKFLIPFLEYCDRQGLTTRTAAGRSWHGT